MFPPNTMPPSGTTRRFAPLVLALIYFLGSVGTAHCVQPEPGDLNGDWDKHFKAGTKAYDAAFGAKHTWSGVSQNTPEIEREYDIAEKEFLAALVATGTFPKGDPRTIQTLGALADLYTEENQFDTAEKFGNQAIAAVESAVGPEGRKLGQDLVHVAMIYDLDASSHETTDHDAKLDMAAPLWQRSLEILSKTPPKDGQADGYSDGHISKQDQQFISALNFRTSMFPLSDAAKLQIYQYLVALSRALGDSVEDQKNLMFQLAHVQRGPDAEKTYTAIWAMARKESGAESLDALEDMYFLAELYTSEGKYAAALPIWLHMKALRQEKGLAMEEAREATRGKGRQKEAAQQQERAVHKIDNELAVLYAATGRYAEAERYYKHVVEECEQATPAKNASALNLQRMDLTEALIRLAVVYRGEGRYDQALAVLKQSEAVDGQITDWRHGNKPVSSSDKVGDMSVWEWSSEVEEAETLREKGDMAGAEAIFHRDMEAMNAAGWLMAPGDARVAHLFGNYANLLRDEGRYEDAEAMYLRALDTWPKNRYPEQPDVAATLKDYAVLLRKRGRAEDATTMETRAGDILAEDAVAGPVQ